MDMENKNLWIGTAEAENIVEIRAIKQYEIDLDKVNSICDLLLLAKSMFPGRVYINSVSPYYEDLKHLAKDEEN